MEWAILMAEPQRRQELRDAQYSQRDIAAMDLLEWHMDHVTR